VKTNCLGGDVGDVLRFAVETPLEGAVGVAAGEIACGGGLPGAGSVGGCCGVDQAQHTAQLASGGDQLAERRDDVVRQAERLGAGEHLLRVGQPARQPALATSTAAECSTGPRNGCLVYLDLDVGGVLLVLEFLDLGAGGFGVRPYIDLDSLRCLAGARAPARGRSCGASTLRRARSIPAAIREVSGITLT
jgi:hypothetical protein